MGIAGSSGDGTGDEEYSSRMCRGSSISWNTGDIGRGDKDSSGGTGVGSNGSMCSSIKAKCH